MNDNELTNDTKFMDNIISQICNYAIDNGLNPTDTFNRIANNLVVIGEITDFDNWEKDGENNG